MITAVTLITALLTTAPPVRLTTPSEEILHLRFDKRGKEISFELQTHGERRVVRYSLGRRHRIDVPPGDRLVRGFVPIKHRTKALINVQADDGRWVVWYGNREPASPAAASDLHPAMSPNQKQIAFVSGRTGNGDIYLVRAGKTNQSPQRMTRHPEPELHPVWSPDSKQLAFLRGADRAQSLIVLAGIGAKQGSNERLVADKNYGVLYASWQPDGKGLAFYGREWGVTTALYRVDTATGMVEKALIDVLPQPNGPTWLKEKDGTYSLVAVRNDDAVVSIDTSNKVTVLQTGTLGNGELASGVIKGKRALAITALGRRGTSNRSLRYRKLYLWYVD